MIRFPSRSKSRGRAGTRGPAVPVPVPDGGNENSSNGNSISRPSFRTSSPNKQRTSSAPRKHGSSVREERQRGSGNDEPRQTVEDDGTKGTGTTSSRGRWFANASPFLQNRGKTSSPLKTRGGASSAAAFVATSATASTLQKSNTRSATVKLRNATTTGSESAYISSRVGSSSSFHPAWDSPKRALVGTAGPTTADASVTHSSLDDDDDDDDDGVGNVSGPPSPPRTPPATRAPPAPPASTQKATSMIMVATTAAVTTGHHGTLDPDGVEFWSTPARSSTSRLLSVRSPVSGVLNDDDDDEEEEDFDDYDDDEGGDDDSSTLEPDGSTPPGLENPRQHRLRPQKGAKRVGHDENKEERGGDVQKIMDRDFDINCEVSARAFHRSKGGQNNGRSAFDLDDFTASLAPSAGMDTESYLRGIDPPLDGGYDRTLPPLGGANKRVIRMVSEQAAPPTEVLTISEHYVAPPPTSSRRIFNGHGQTADSSEERRPTTNGVQEDSLDHEEKKLAQDLAANLVRDLEATREDNERLLSRNRRLQTQLEQFRLNQEENMIYRSRLVKACLFSSPVFIFCGGLDAFLSTILLVWVLVEVESYMDLADREAGEKGVSGAAGRMFYGDHGEEDNDRDDDDDSSGNAASDVQS